MTRRERIAEKVRDIAQATMGGDIARFTDDARFQELVDAKTLRGLLPYFEFFEAVYVEFGADITADEIDNIKTFGDLIDAIESQETPHGAGA